MSQLYFTGRVAVVTGAGNGLGRAYALLLASKGAKVVVNDLGGDRNGLGNSKQADIVVNEIRNNGGIAVPNYDSVIDGEKIIQTALENFGRLDILINNAGILRDRSFANISDKDWDLIHDVHLKGSFKTTQAAWPIFKKQNYGRIVMTSSMSGLGGNFGQANYSSAKMGVIGLAYTLAIEGDKYNIHCNVVVPSATSRLTEELLPEILRKELKPDLIAPVVAFLCHESNETNGRIIESGAGWGAQIHSIRNEDIPLRKSIAEDVTIEAVRDVWDKISDMSKVTKTERITNRFLKVIEAHKNPNVEEVSFIFSPKNVALYALGIGATVNDQDDLKYLYESHPDFTPFPTFFVLGSALRLNLIAASIPHVKFDLSNLLHGEHYIEVNDHLPTDGVLKIKCQVAEVIDKKSGALIYMNSESINENGQIVAKCQSGLFILGAGNFNGKTKPSNDVVSTVPVPARNPDASIRMNTHIDQAAIYRLSGDFNPLHIDPEFAKRAGQPKAILHGLCTMGLSMRAILKTYANNDSSKFKAMKVRFVKPVIPGQTLQVDTWVNGSRIHFTTTVVETQTVVITGAFVDLRSAPIITAAPAITLQSDAIFEKIAEKVKADPKKMKAINGVFVYKITNNGKEVKEWTLDLKNGDVYNGEPKGIKPNTTVTIDDADMIEIAAGRLSGQAAFTKGKIKVKGNFVLLQRLAPLLKEDHKL